MRFSRLRPLPPLLSALVAIWAGNARADVGWHVDLGGSMAVTKPQSDEFGPGGTGAVRADIALSRGLGFVLGVGSTYLTAGTAPDVSTGFAAKSAGIVTLPKIGLLWHAAAPDVRHGLWAQLAGGAALTGDLIRPAGTATLGYAFALNDRTQIGPFAEYTYIYQPNDTLRPEDAHIATVGISLGFGPPPRDKDLDGVFDSVDACPTVPGVRSDDPAKNGCPVDETPVEQPPAEDLDPDKDGIMNPGDACPDVPGIASTDPKKNGCPEEIKPPEDPDGDGVVYPHDACPGVAGIPSDDAKTNGCPKPEGSVHVEEDKIVVGDTVLFDTDSPRVRHRAWPTLQNVAKFIKDNPDIREVTVEGHADATGTEEYNMRLSLDRAMAVRRMLIKYGVKADRIQAESFGRSRLRVQTNRAEIQNRRVELWVTRSRETKDPVKP